MKNALRDEGTGVGPRNPISNKRCVSLLRFSHGILEVHSRSWVIPDTRAHHHPDIRNVVVPRPFGAVRNSKARPNNLIVTVTDHVSDFKVEIG